MKKLNLLNRKELKMILGGTAGPGPGNPIDTTCTTSCSCPAGWILKTGVVFKLTVECEGDCVTSNGSGVTCLGITDNCSDYINDFCTAPIIV